MVGVEAVLGYLTVYLLRGAGRVADSVFDALVNRLVQTVEARLGSGAVDELSTNPRDPTTRDQIRRQVNAQMAVDPEFASTLKTLVDELDRQGGQDIINQVYARNNLQIINSPGAWQAGRDINVTDINVPDPTDVSDAPGWVKLCLVAGPLIAISGLGIFFYTLFTGMNTNLEDPHFGETPSGIPIAFGVFFVGLVISAIGGLGRAVSSKGR